MSFSDAAYARTAPSREPVLIAGALVIGALVALLAGVVIVTAVWSILAAAEVVVAPDRRWPRLAAMAVIALPVLCFILAALLARRTGGRTFYDQQRANRRASALLLLTLVGVLSGVGEIIVGSITFDAYPTLVAGGVAALLGLGGALFASRAGDRLVLASAGARPADPTRHRVLFDVVQELSIAADVPPPALYVVPERSLNAFAIGRDPRRASIAGTSARLEALDREQLQGVIGHELAHVRNLDTRYGQYVAILVGLVALVTDGFLHLVVEGWRQGAFFWKSDDKGVIVTLAAGILFGLLLLLVASLLRLFAPLFSVMVQAASNRQRELLADAAAVELTRNPIALERALQRLASDRDPVEAANRGSQHLWFCNPVKEGDDGSLGLLATHPSIDARISRLRALRGISAQIAPA